MSGAPNSYAYLGTQDQFSDTGDINTLSFVIERIVNRISVCTLAQVQAVSNTPGQVTSVGTVDVLPLVNLLNGYGQATKHQVVYGLPYFRFAGGSNAVLLDPQVNDIGLVIFADRDISSVKSNQQQSNPGSLRRFDFADGIYIGLCLGQSTPNQYLSFTNEGITIQDKNGNTIQTSSSGVSITDSHGNTIATSSSGITNTVKSGNKVTATAGGSLAAVETSAGASPVSQADS